MCPVPVIAGVVLDPFSLAKKVLHHVVLHRKMGIHVVPISIWHRVAPIEREKNREIVCIVYLVWWIPVWSMHWGF